MQLSDARPISDFALQYGMKAIVYGPAGAAKSPICASTSPDPFLLFTEPGAMSMRKMSTPAYAAFNPAKVDEFMLWWLNSQEATRFQTLIWDSVSESCEKFIEIEQGGTSKAGNEQHGQRIYGKMSSWMMRHLSSLYYQPGRNIILICKQQMFDINGGIYIRPYFPGKELPVKVPHRYDLITRLGEWIIPGVQTPAGANGVRAFWTREQFNQMGRDRSGNLAEFEPPNVAQLIAKFKA